MILELSETQAQELRDVLESHLEGLLEELARTDDREYRASLRETYDRLEHLRRRLDTALESVQAYA